MRIVYRIFEFTGGVSSSNTILTHESYSFGLDAAPMTLALTLLNIMHPGFVLRGAESEFPRMTRSEKKAIKAQKKEEKRQRKEDKRQRKAEYKA